MSDEILLTIGDDGKASLYDDTYDITIHCESKEEQDEVKRILENMPHWIPVTEPPTDRTICYVTLKDTNDENRQNWVVEMIYTPWDGFDLMDGIEAIAWMPKQYPEPYKEVTT